MKQAPSFTAVLMVGGQSRRMGRDKATLPWQNGFLWEHQLKTLLRLDPENIVLSSPEDLVWRPQGVDWVPDGESGSGFGPMGGLLAVLQRMTTTHLILLAIDMPRVTSDFLRQLMSMTELGKAVVPVKEGYFEGLAAIYPKESLPFVRVALNSSDYSFQGFIAGLDRAQMLWSRQLGPEEYELMTNLNDLSSVTKESVGKDRVDS